MILSYVLHFYHQGVMYSVPYCQDSDVLSKQLSEPNLKVEAVVGSMVSMVSCIIGIIKNI